MTPVVEISNVSYSYETNKQILHDINLNIYAGEVLCILGCNGCGKSTLLKTLIGNYRNFQGNIIINQKNLKKISATELAQQLTIVFQEHTAPFPYSVYDIVKMGRSPHLSVLGVLSKEDKEIVELAMEQVGVTYLRDQPYTQISGGERQLVLIARAIAQKTDIILLDEPTSQLDFRNQMVILKTLHTLAKKFNIAIVMTTHSPDQALIFPSKVALMYKGTFITYGKGEEVLTDENLTKVYNMGVRVLTVTDELDRKTHTVCIPQAETI